MLSKGVAEGCSVAAAADMNPLLLRLRYGEEGLQHWAFGLIFFDYL
jgi:hypothetical protein